MSADANFFLTHDRPISLNCDDSVTRVVAGAEFADSPLARRHTRDRSPCRSRCRRPLGGQLKTTFAMGRGHHANLLSHHIGDLDHYEAYRPYREAIKHTNSFDQRPEVLVHDLHADYSIDELCTEPIRAQPRRSPFDHHATWPVAWPSMAWMSR